MDNWSAIAKVYDPLKAGSIDATDTEPHDHGIIRAMAAKYKPNKKDVVGDPEKTIFIARLNPKTNETTIEKVFSGYGIIKQFRLVRDIITGYSRCYAFVEYYDHKEAEDAVWRGHKQEIDGCEVFVDYECERVLKGWVPRRLGGGFGGKKESGQLRFGGRDRPFRKPIYNKMIALKNVNDEHHENAWDDKSSEHGADGHENYRGTNRVRSDRSNKQYYVNLNIFKSSEKNVKDRDRRQNRDRSIDRERHQTRDRSIDRERHQTRDRSIDRERHQTRDRSRERDKQYSRYTKSSQAWETSPHQTKQSRETAGERRGSNRDRDRTRSSDGSRDRIGDNRSRDKSRDRSGERRQDRSGERSKDRSEKRRKRSRDSKRETSEDRERGKYIDRRIDKGKHLERSDYRENRAPETYYDERTINRLIQTTVSSIWDEHEHDKEQNSQTNNEVTEDLEVPEN
ncbi:U11/U12 small nuclear ribonucleoprotein 35 kDa protein-like isoform X2 [Mytilus californianus]|uniref:U11/U12 small nuclear ribonucleoprotein 35 kDa protein-like isoform X2 n=1 Tax=Mytilus californianus TaxID=6549 RepID=UPI0022463BE7|nr:U11/U12 small nuclear ribonucleoprotein 35 kDa protein-like isoform X2 [Mytilus californianus]